MRREVIDIYDHIDKDELKRAIWLIYRNWGFRPLKPSLYNIRGILADGRGSGRPCELLYPNSLAAIEKRKHEQRQPSEKS